MLEDFAHAQGEIQSSHDGSRSCSPVSTVVDTVSVLGVSYLLEKNSSLGGSATNFRNQ